MNIKYGSVPCGARILGRAGTAGCMRASQPRGQSPHGWMGANAARSTTDHRQEHPDVPLIWSDHALVGVSGSSARGRRGFLNHVTF